MKDTVLYKDAPVTYQENIKGWVTPAGRFWGEDEHMARLDACTHRECTKCGDPVEKTYTACSRCREIQRDILYAQMPIVEWDGETPLAIFDGDEFFYSEDELRDYKEENNIQALKIVLCEEVPAPRIDVDHYCDYLPEDEDLSYEAQNLLDSFNDSMAALLPKAWTPGRKRVMV
jgi:hypothetical protein